MGGRITENGDGLWTEGALRGADLVFFLPSMGAMENAMLAAMCAAGTTAIIDVAREPGIVDLQGSLRAIGTKVYGAGNSVIAAEGGVPLRGGSCIAMGDHTIAATYLAVAVSAGGMVEMMGADYRHLSTVSAVLRGVGCDAQNGVESIRLRWDGPFQGVRSVRTASYPGFPTGTQVPLMATLTRRKGCTVFVENIFEGRYRHMDELSRMEANTRMEGRVAVVYGVPRPRGVQVRATDLRGGTALVVATLGAEGRSGLTGAHHIDRGYQSLEGDLHHLGAEIRRI